MEKRTYSAEQVAKFTHLPEKKVIKLAESGELDGQKTQGQWCFSKADLLVWFEKSLTGDDIDQRLSSMEDFAENHVPQEDPEELPLAKLLDAENILFPFAAKTKDSVIRTLAQKGAEMGKIWDPDRLADALRQREEMLSTAMDNGVAILHPRRPMPDNTGEPFVLLGVALRGIPFGNNSGKLTDVFFLVCATDDKTHLRLLAEIARLLRRPGFLDQLREAETIAEIVDLIRS